jgi:hypothetical protein
MCDFFDVSQRDVPDTTLNPTVVSPMQSAPLRSLFLIDLLLFSDAPNCTTEANAYIDGHRIRSWSDIADA